MELLTLIIWIFVNILDLHSSLIAIKKWGIEVEKNSWARKFYKKFGLIRGLSIFKAVFIVAWSFIILIPWGWLVLWAGVILIGHQVIINYRIIKKYENNKCLGKMVGHA